MFTVDEVLKATAGRLISGQPQQSATGVSCDSRTIAAGELFIALKGKNFNGHDFVSDCLKKGAVGLIVSEREAECVSTVVEHHPAFVVKVRDTLKALGDIAHFHRMRFGIPVVAITGSNGKTTTKDMTAGVLAMKYKVLKSHETFNNLIGVPLTLLKLNKDHQICVLEMGTSRVGEIARLTDIAEPDIGVITNVGPSHLEFFKDIETVSQAKMEIFAKFSGEDVAVWNADDSMLSGLYQILNCKSRTFGLSVGCDFQATDIEAVSDGWRFMLNAAKPMRIKLLGEHNIYNALAAIAVGDLLKVEYSQMYFVLSNFSAPSMRMEILKAQGVTIINDCYNSNPKSMESAINVLSNFNTSGRRVLVSGDMLELGEISGYFHHQLGLNVAGSRIDIFIGVGSMSKEAAAAALVAGMNKDAVWFCRDAEEAGRLLLDILHSGDAVLIKGSRAMRMEKICSTIYSTP